MRGESVEKDAVQTRGIKAAKKTQIGCEKIEKREMGQKQKTKISKNKEWETFLSK